MSKSIGSGRTGAARAGFEYFDRRQIGPWVALRPLFRGWGLVVPSMLGVILVVSVHLPVVAVVALMTLLFLCSFKLTWQIIGLVIRSRAFLLVVTLLVAGNLWLCHMFGDIAGNVVMVALVVALLAFRPTAPFLWARFWCVFDRHRMRAGLKVCKVRTMNLDGALPFMLWARPTKTGERVWLWIRAGSSGDDIEDALRYIAPACLAREARIHRVRRLTTIVGVEIIRRDPLGTGEKIPSPLSSLVTYVKDMITGEGIEPITPMSVDDITATEPQGAERLTRRSGRKTTAAAGKPTEPVNGIVVDGEDLSDYID